MRRGRPRCCLDFFQHPLRLGTGWRSAVGWNGFGWCCHRTRGLRGKAVGFVARLAGHMFVGAGKCTTLGQSFGCVMKMAEREFGKQGNVHASHGLPGKVQSVTVFSSFGMFPQFVFGANDDGDSSNAAPVSLLAGLGKESQVPLSGCCISYLFKRRLRFLQYS